MADLKSLHYILNIDNTKRYFSFIYYDHLIDMKTGQVVEFVDPEIERLQQEIARRLGYKLVDHRLELYGVPLDDKSKAGKKAS